MHEYQPYRLRLLPFLGFLPAVLVAIFFIAVTDQVQANTIFAGNIKLVEGVTEKEYVKVIRPGFTKILVGKPGDAIFEGDTIKTDNGVKAQIELSDQTLISLAPNGSLQIAGYMAERSAARRNTVFKAMKGTMRFIVAKLFKSNGSGERAWQDSSVTIETMNAVAGVRGTDLFVSLGAGDTEIAVLDGVVGVRSSKAGLNGEVMVSANQMSVTKMGAKPSMPEGLATDRRESLLRATALDKAMSLLNGEIGKALAAKKKYDKKSIQRDLAAGKPLARVIDNAVEAGMVIEDIVYATIDAGANPGLVVYTFIQEGYSPSKVVEAAITAGVPANVVFTAAVSAGADQQAIITGAEGAGLPPEAIADRLTNMDPVDVDKISAIPPGPSPTTPFPGLPPAPISIGGGGGTPIASPYKP